MEPGRVSCSWRNILRSRTLDVVARELFVRVVDGARGTLGKNTDARESITQFSLHLENKKVAAANSRAIIRTAVNIISISIKPGLVTLSQQTLCLKRIFRVTSAVSMWC